MDAILITDVSALTVFVMCVVLGGAFMAVGASISCAVKRGVERGLKQSKANHAAIELHGDAIRRLTARLDDQGAQLTRIEEAMPKRRTR